MLNYKYRIFDTKYNEYCEDPDYRWLLSRNGKLYNSENDEWYIIGDRYFVELSTGIFDCNNIEIFEGNKYSDDEGGYFMIQYDNDLSKFCVNSYSYEMSFNEGGGEVYSNEISLIDENIMDVIDIRDLEYKLLVI